jgi:hypothetical protein
MGNGNCVEMATDGRAIVVRDSKDPGGPVLAYSTEAWAAFTRNACLGHYDTRIS